MALFGPIYTLVEYSLCMAGGVMAAMAPNGCEEMDTYTLLPFTMSIIETHNCDTKFTGMCLCNWKTGASP